MGITILGAVFGTKKNGIDVTKNVQSIVKNDNDDVTATMKALGCDDPDPGKTKSFGVLYKLSDGTSLARACSEGETIDLAIPPS